MRIVAFLYGIVCYVLFLGVFLGAIAFVGDVVPAIPVSVDRGPSSPLGLALGIDALLLTLFALQHSVMARPAFKRWWTRFVPPAVERSTYVLFSSLALLALLVFWRPVPGLVWNFDGLFGVALGSLRVVGWATVLLSTFMISHFDLFGLKQVYAHLRKQRLESPPFQTFGFYRLVRHPLMLGFMIAFWATPVMSFGHLVFALATTGYILMALRLEEADLVRSLGDTYRSYQRNVPMLLPIPKAEARVPEAKIAPSVR